MHKIYSGTARSHGSGVWRIVDPAGTILTKYDRAAFDHILHKAAVYYIDLDLDPEYCENVQPQFDVDDRVAAAKSENGYETGAEPQLRSYLMDALMEATLRTGEARTEYLNSLDAKMLQIHTKASALASKKVTIALLKRHGVTA